MRFLGPRRVGLPGWSLACVIASVLILLAPRSQAPEREGEGDAKRKTESSGLSLLGETRVEPIPSPSAVAGFDSERVWSGYDDWEPAIAADPSSTYVYQMTTRYNGPAACSGCPFPVIVFRSSSDSGATWSADKFLAVTKKKQNDPEIEVASDGVIYAAWMDDYTPGVKFTKSTNHGVSWSTPIGFTGKGKKPNWSDKPMLAISRDGRDVYVAFNASHSYVVASHDYGRTFSAPVKTNSDTRYWFHTGGVVTTSGVVYFACVDFTQDYTGDSHINVIRSTNGGLAWSTIRIDTSSQMPGCAWAAGCTLGFLGPSAVITADVTGSLMIAYNAGDVASAPQAMYERTSTDGTTWGARKLLSTGPGTVNTGFPAITAGPSAGDFRLIWQDDRNGSTTAWNAWYRRTVDGGATWSTAARMSDLGTGAPYKTAAGHRFPYGDYLEIAADSTGRNHMIWGEGTSFTGPGGSWYARGQ